MKLKVLHNTVLKQGTDQSVNYSDEEKQSVKAATEFAITHYEQVEANHLRIVLQGASFKGKSIWYVYAPHVEVLDAIPTTQLRAKVDTVLKQRPVQSSSLANNDKHSMHAGTIFTVHSYQVAEANHIKVALLDASFKGRNTWYAYAPHVELTNPDGSKLEIAPPKKVPDTQTRRPVKRRPRTRDEIYDAFFDLLEENEGRVTTLQFARKTLMPGDRAKRYLDERAEEFNATFEVNDRGDIYYVFAL